MSRKMISLLALIVILLEMTGCASGPDVAEDPLTIQSPTAPPTIFTAPGLFDSIDQHALQAPPELKNNLPKLANYLTQPAQNDAEKARAIFRWIAQNISYDYENYFKGNVPNQTTAKTLATGMAVCDGYSNLFNTLAKLSGVKAQTIRGKAKGYAYAMRGKAGLINHAWNSVRIDGHWYLLDSSWGAGYIDSETKRFVRDFESHYFLTPPDQFIFDHLPNDQRWQLLETPLTEKEFTLLPYLRPRFFTAGLQLQSHHQERIVTDENPLTVHLGVPKESYISVRLYKGHNKFPRSHVKLRRDGEFYTITTTFPEPGNDYRLRVFTKRGVQSREFDWALDYRVSHL